jgi:hypothetical protein
MFETYLEQVLLLQTVSLIDQQVTALKLSKIESAEAQELALPFAIQLLCKWYLHWPHHKEPLNLMCTE